MDVFNLALKLDYLISLSSFDVGHQKSVVGQSNSRDNRRRIYGHPGLK